MNRMAIVLIFAFGGWSVFTESAPNVIVILADDLGFSDLSCYGGEIETPVLDSLAEGGLRLSSLSNTAKCHSSRVSLLSGLWCHQAGNVKLSRAVTFADLLRQAGYATGMVGKWHLHKTPRDFGFEKYFGHLSGASPYIEGNKTFLLNGEPYSQFGNSADEFYLTDANTDYAIRFLKEWKQADADKPFLLYMAYNAPHSPLQAPEALVRKYRGRYMSGWEKTRASRFERQKKLGMFDDNQALPAWPDNQRRWDDLSENEKSWEDLRMAVYAAMVDSLDQNIGRVVQELKAEGEWENTLFLFMSDNGANPYERSNGLQILPWMAGAGLRIGTEWASVCNTPFRWYKQNAHRGGVSTPGIIHWPAGLKAKGWNRTPAHLVDIMPTLLELAGAEYPSTFKERTVEPLAGESLMPLLRGESMLRKKPIYYNYANSHGLYDGRYKLVSLRGGPWELYDLESDPLETRDLIAQQPERAATMGAEWMQIAEDVDQAPLKDREPRALDAVPWGTAMKSAGRGEIGGPKSDEQHPEFGKRKPPLPLPQASGSGKYE